MTSYVRAHDYLRVRKVSSPVSYSGRGGGGGVLILKLLCREEASNLLPS